MILNMNESEVTDGVCVAVANMHSNYGEPSNVNVVELGQRKNGQFYAEAIYFGVGGDVPYTLDTQQILDGIASFLVEFHNYNFEELGFDGELLIGQNGTIQAIITFNEG